MAAEELILFMGAELILPVQVLRVEVSAPSSPIFLSSDIFPHSLSHSPQGWKQSFGTEVWGKGNLLYPAPSHNAILGKPAISSYLRKLSLGLGWFFFPFRPPQMGTLGFYVDRNQSNVSQGRWATAKIGWMRGSVHYSCKEQKREEGRKEGKETKGTVFSSLTRSEHIYPNKIFSCKLLINISWTPVSQCSHILAQYFYAVNE